MADVDIQLHGYRRGHELLASSIMLSKTDQSMVDRLSDVAGPLRPSERFEPYLTGYPLPSGDRYVLARTWQDATVPRAGCVRTLSLLIPAAMWGDAWSISPFLAVLDPSVFPEPSSAVARDVVPPRSAPDLPPTPAFPAGELLETLFLEESKPIAVFDAPSPELIALRLLTALWPAYRRRFSFSTFARSPRRVEGRYFDVVFAPKDARSKFANWPGRRLDGGGDRDARHRWTGTIVQRVFEEPQPRLMSDRDIALVGNEGAETPAALRIALLWDELVDRIEDSPTAALGLLDIANSRAAGEARAYESIDPAISEAVSRAVRKLSQSEAWDFVSAIARKMAERPLFEAQRALLEAVAELARLAPEGAVTLAEPAVGDHDSALAELLPSIATGLGADRSGRADMFLAAAAPQALGRLIAASRDLAARAANTDVLMERLAVIVPWFSPALLAATREQLLPLLVEDRQLGLFAPLLMSLDTGDLIEEVRYLGRANDFGASSFLGLLVERAKATGATVLVRDTLTLLPGTDGRDRFLFATLAPDTADLEWLLNAPRIERNTRSAWLARLLRGADRAQFSQALQDVRLRDGILGLLPNDAADLRLRALTDANLPLSTHVTLLLQMRSMLDDRQRGDLAGRALARCLRETFGGDEQDTLKILIESVGANLDGSWAARHGLDRALAATLVSRNLKAFAKVKGIARERLLARMDEVGRVLEGRHVIDYDGGAVEALANLLLESSNKTYSATLEAAGMLLPIALRSRREPASPLVAATFPFVYRELSKESEVPDILKFFIFIDWDRCKTARSELVSAFMSSSWAPGDLALTACRSDDVGKILRKAAKAPGGDAYMGRVASDLGRLGKPCRVAVESTILSIRSNWASKLDWRD